MATPESDASAAPTASRALRAAELTLLCSVGFALIMAAMLAVGVSRNRGFQVDEVEHIHVAYNIRDGRVPYADFWEGHNPLLHVLLVPVVDVDDAVASFQRARMVTLLLLLATVAMGAVCARRLGGNVAAAITAALLLLHSTFIERGMEVRPDIGLALCAMIALALQLSQRPVLHRYCWQALALSAAFLFTTKAVFICFAFGVVWLWSAVRDRRPALVAVPMAVWLAPVIAMIAVFAIAGNLDEYWDYNVRDALFHAGRSADFSFSPWKYMGREVGRNRVFVAAAVVGIGYGFAVGWGRSRRARSWGAGVLAVLLLLALRADSFLVTFFGVATVAATAVIFRDLHVDNPAGHRMAAAVAAVALATLWLNPFPFPYLHVSVVPLLAVPAGLVIARVLDAHELGSRRLVRLGFVAGSIVAIGWTSAGRLIDKAEDTTEYQFANLTALQDATEPDDRVFDMVGLYFRPDAYPVFTMTGVMAKRYKKGKFPRMVPELRDHRVVAFIRSYRSRWLGGKEKAFIRGHFVRYAGSVYVLGTKVPPLSPGQVIKFVALKDKQFRYDGSGEILVDGQPFTTGLLTRGEHTITVTQPIAGGKLILASTSREIPEILQAERSMYDGADFD